MSELTTILRACPRPNAPRSTAERCARPRLVSLSMRATGLVCFALTFCASIFGLIAQPASAQDDIADAISSQRFIVIDAATGEVFAEKDSHDQVAIASLTKIFTTIEAIERAPLTMQITTDES